MKFQYLRVLDYLKEHNPATTNELRQMAVNQGHPIVDIPKCVSILVDKGYPVTSKRNHDGSATYYLGELPQPKVLKAEDFVWTNNKAVRIEDVVMKQGRIF